MVSIQSPKIVGSMLFSRKLVFALAVFIACCMPSMAGAQGSAGDRAKGLFVAGKGQYKQKQYLEALHSFQQALELVDRPSIVIMIANCHRQLQQPEKALTHYRDYLADWRRKNPGKPSPYQAVVEGHISHMKTIVELVERGEALLQEGNPASALPSSRPRGIRTAGPGSVWASPCATSSSATGTRPWP